MEANSLGSSSKERKTKAQTCVQISMRLGTTGHARCVTNPKQLIDHERISPQEFNPTALRTGICLYPNLLDFHSVMISGSSRGACRTSNSARQEWNPEIKQVYFRPPVRNVLQRDLEMLYFYILSRVIQFTSTN